MKLLLSSGGLTNNSIAAALVSLAGKPAKEISVAFIITAAMAENGDKSWLVEDLSNLQKQDFKSLEIIDIASADKHLWLPKIEAADVLFFGGGDNYYLMSRLETSGLAGLLPELLKTKVYAGISAGSMVASRSLDLSSSQLIYDEDLDRMEDAAGLGLVDFYFFPHLNSPHFPHVRPPQIAAFAKEHGEKVYALDDDSALKIEDDRIELISEGESLVFNER